MHESTPAPIAVTVPHDGVDSALRFAAREALVRGCPIRVMGPPAPGPAPRTPSDLAQRAATLLKVLAGPGVLIDLPTPPSTDLETVLEICRDAAMVVVPRTQVLALLHTLSYGAVGARALTDVACVPADWTPRPDDGRPVVLGADDPFHALSLLTAGVQDARAHHTWLKIIHAWYLPYHLGTEKDERLEALWSDELARHLEQQLSEIDTDDVGHLVEVRRSAPADLVLEAARGAQHLLLGRNPASSDHLCHLGRTARTAIHESPCPVILLARPTRPATDRASAPPDRTARAPAPAAYPDPDGMP